jgi:hypothetical protein
MRRNNFNLIVIVIAVLSSTSAFATKHVNGYTKRDGSYVAPHHRSDPNRTQRDNYSSKPNVNPYNGKRGTKEPTH